MRTMKNFNNYFLFFFIVFSSMNSLKGQSDTSSYLFLYYNKIENTSSNEVINIIKKDTTIFSKNQYDIFVFTYGPWTNTFLISINDSIVTIREFKYNYYMKELIELNKRIVYFNNIEKYIRSTKGYFQAWTNNTSTDLYRKEIQVFVNSKLYSLIYIINIDFNENKKLPRFNKIDSLIAFFEKISI